MNIGLKIKELMVQEKIEVSDLARQLGKTKQAVYDILEKKDLNTSLLRSLASIFNVPIIFFLDDSPINQNLSGTSNVVIGRDNHGNISVAEYKDKLENAQKEIEHLNQLLKEKEKFIEILTSLSPKRSDAKIKVYSIEGVKEIDILQIENIIQCTGKESEFIDKVNSGSGREFPYCIITVNGEKIPIVYDSAYVWNLITQVLANLLKQ